jgi:uncharacterized membrane protein YbhN (UPF0104 family)
MIATFYSLVLPGNIVAGGISWYKLSRPERKFIEAGALLIFFRLVHIASLIGIGLIAALGDPLVSSPTFVSILIFMSMGLFIVLLLFFSNRTSKLLNHLNYIMKGNSSFFMSVFENIEQLLNTAYKFRSLGLTKLLLVFGLSLFSQFLGILNFFLLALAVDIRLSIYIIGWIRSFVSIVQMIPISVAGLGLREVSLTVLLNDYRISPEQAISYSLTIFGVIIITAIVGGFFELSDIYRNWQQRANSVTDQSENITNKTSVS